MPLYRPLYSVVIFQEERNPSSGPGRSLQAIRKKGSGSAGHLSFRARQSSTDSLSLDQDNTLGKTGFRTGDELYIQSHLSREA